jgi:hypothetical protein
MTGMSNETKHATTDDAEVVEILQLLTEWHAAQVGNLRKIIENSGAAIELQGAGGESVKLTGDIRRGFVMGVSVAVEWLGKLPLTMERAAEEDEEDDDDAP